MIWTPECHEMLDQLELILCMGNDILIGSKILALIPQKPHLLQRLKCKHFIEACDPGGRATKQQGGAKRDLFPFSHRNGQLVSPFRAEDVQEMSQDCLEK